MIISLQSYGIRPGKCIDDEYIQRVFDREVTHEKDKSQRNYSTQGQGFEPRSAESRSAILPIRRPLITLVCA